MQVAIDGGGVNNYGETYIDRKRERVPSRRNVLERSTLLRVLVFRCGSSLVLFEECEAG